MLKTFVTAALLSATLIGVSALPANASFSSADCAYARMNLENGFGETRSGHYNPNAAVLQQCGR